METGYSKWRKLDNAALAFPLVTGKNDTRVFRFYCECKETVNPEVLQEALDETMKKYPLFQAVLRKGLFWFYLEHRDIYPQVREEKKPPCSRLYIPDKKSLLFEVTYYKKRINFEVYHALTDGTGAMHFLQELVQNYLILLHPEDQLEKICLGEESTLGDQEEDSFSQYYMAENSRAERKPHAVRLKGEKLPHEDMKITELNIPVKEIHKKAKSYGVSITIFLAAVMLCAIGEEIPRNKRKKPVALMIPVNLRNYFPSQSMANFFGWIEVGHTFTENTTLKEVVDHVKVQFEQELSRENVAQRMNGYVRLEKNPFIRAVPLEIKKYFLMLGASLGSRSITAVYSNIGIVRFPPRYEKYIDHFGIFASTDILQLCSCSYQDQMLLGFTSKLPNDNIQRNFQKILRKEEVDFREEEQDFPGRNQEREKEGKQIFRMFTFLCIVAAVASAVLDYLITGDLNWFWFVAAGTVCTWLLVAVAYSKRRNILKNEMWQLLLVTILAVLWDRYTGWIGWSLDFVLPIGALGVLCSMAVIAKVQHLEREEYLFYLVQAALAGCVPVILTFLNLTTFVYPSVICSGISFLVLAGLLIFQKKDTLREFHKKLRM